jgi:hypothetical protein
MVLLPLYFLEDRPAARSRVGIGAQSGALFWEGARLWVMHGECQQGGTLRGTANQRTGPANAVSNNTQ